MTAGRPTKLNYQLISKAKTYIETCVDKPIWTDKGAIAYTEVNLPTKVGLALFLGINKDTIEEWCKPYEPEPDTLMVPEVEEHSICRTEFSVIVKEIQHEQEKRLISNGLGGLYKEKTTGMILSKHGYAEKTETDITTKGEKITQDSSEIEEIAKRVGEELKKKNQ